jgi:uncharacterized protein
MGSADLNAELSDNDYEILDSVLSRVVGGKILNLEALDGFLTALVVCPDLVPPSEFIPVITSGETADGDLVFESPKEAEAFFGILMRYWNEINGTFQSGDFYMPYLIEDEHGNVHGNDWAKGFQEGTRLRYETWAEIIHDEERGGPFIPILALVYENADDPDLRPFKEPITEQQREALIAGMVAGARNLYEIFREEEQWSNSGETVFAPSSHKVGRNDPCPCGSGKKFKKCCGQKTFQ